MTKYHQLDPRQRLMGRINGILPSLSNLPPKLLRRVLRGFDASLGLSKTQMRNVVKLDIPSSTFNGSIKARAYYPTTEMQSALVYFHGGGCVIGDLNTHDAFCRLLAHHGKQVVIAINYRLAPEHKFPEPVYDAIDSWNWVIANADNLGISGKPVGVGGDSAGGYFSTVIGLLNEQKALPVQVAKAPAFQFLIYPLTDQRGSTDSYEKYSNDLLLTTAMVDYFKHHFLASNDQETLPLASPVLSQHLADSPTTYLLTAEFDPLLDSGKAYVEKLKQNGVEVFHRHLPDCMHQFISVTKISPRAKQASLQVAQDLADFTSQLVQK